MIQIGDDACAGGGNARHAVEQRVKVRFVVARQVEGNRGNHSQHDPSQTGDNKGLLAVEPSGLYAQKAQARPYDKRNANGQQIVGRRNPFLKRKSRRKRHQQRQGREQHEHAQVVADDPDIV